MTSPERFAPSSRSARWAAAWCGQDAASVAAFYEENGSLSVNEDAPAIGWESITAVS